MASAYETHETDVLVIGAGGAGLRAAIEASATGAKVAVVSKSLLGKAHTVMAEGGVAAALSNADDRDSWKVHFADTMRGGQYLNSWRMAEIHAKEAPDRVNELEAWGALFDRTKDGRILQRNFGGHRYPRLAHVGDRTGLEMIRTLQDHGIHRGIDFFMEHTTLTLLKDGDRVVGAFGYDRERGYFRVFHAKAVVLATGGVGRAFKITSNSWEYTGDGHALAYKAGAELVDMEFVQFHPTGMVWPPSVRGILVTEGVRGEGGVLKNKEGRRFMFDDIPENYKNQTADTPEEGWKYCQGDKNARRPPELLTRDHVARCIMREVRAGRGSPHGGVFLDIAWIKDRISNGAEHIKKKLPSMYHQFKELAEIDITSEPMEVGPTPHYIMGGVRVDPDTQMSAVPGLFAAGECGGGLHGANRLGGNSLSDLLVFGKRAGEHAALFAKEHGAGKVDQDALATAEKAGARAVRARARRERLQGAERPARDDAGAGRHRPQAGGHGQSPGQPGRLPRPRGQGQRRREPRLQPRLAHRDGPRQPDRVRGDHARRARAQGEPRRPFPRGLPRQGQGSRQVQPGGAQDRGRHGGRAEADLRNPARAEGHHRGASQVTNTATFRVWRGDRERGELKDYTTEVSSGMVVLDAVHQIQSESAPDLAARWNCKAGKCGSCSAEINGMPRLMCMTRLNELPLDQPVVVEPMKAFPPVKDLVTDVKWNFAVKKRIKPFKPRKPDAPDGTWRMKQEDIERVQEFRKCIECFLCQDVCHVLRDHHKHGEFSGPRYFVYNAQLEMHPLDTDDRVPDLKNEDGIGYCNITKCCTKVCPEEITITDNAIIPLKERVVDRFYDPLKRLFRVFSK